MAANFIEAAKEIAAAFETSTGKRTLLSFGSTGQLYANISQEAPFDVFLAADQERPRLAEKQGLAVAGSRFTYARGRLALFSSEEDLVTGKATLERNRFQRLAVANPATAPYGVAAIEVLRALGVYERLQNKLVRGNNIAQAFQFVETGNAELGFVALSQAIEEPDGSFWLVPEDLHAPIAQDAVLLKRGADNPAARAFVAFLNGPEARKILADHGYGLGSGE